MEAYGLAVLFSDRLQSKQRSLDWSIGAERVDAGDAVRWGIREVRCAAMLGVQFPAVIVSG